MKTITMRLLLCASMQTLAADKIKSDSWSEDGVLKMNLELIALPDNDLQKAQMKLTVTNTSTNDIVLDEMLAAGFSLRFKTDLSKEYTRSDDKDVSTTEVMKLEKPTDEVVRARFVPLKPGQSLSCTYDLATTNRCVVSGHGTDMNHVHHGFYHEAMKTYHVPEKARTLFIDAWYERGVWMMATAQFEAWYGQSAKTLGLWSGRARSNTLVIEKTKNPEQSGPPNHHSPSAPVFGGR